MNLRCPQCHDAFDVSSQESGALVCPNCQELLFPYELESFHEDDTSVPDSDPVELGVGDFLEHFELVELVGRGTFGSVYRAFDSRLVRDVAIKVPRRRSPQLVGGLDGMIREARIAAQLTDENIVSIHEVGQANEFSYIVSDFVDGVDLETWASKEGRVPQRIALVLEKIARAIDRAHQEGIIHRDIKPSNILVDATSEPRLTDFGLAMSPSKELGREKKGKGGGAPGGVLGTPVYMSPEQASGMSEHCGAASDIYSLGVTLFQALTGELPFYQNASVLDSILTGNKRKLTEIRPDAGKELEAICSKAMALDPGQRFRSAHEFAEDLKRYRAGAPTLALAEARQFRLNHVSHLLMGAALAFAIAILGWIFSEKINWKNEAVAARAIPALPVRKSYDIEIEVSHPHAILGACLQNYDENQYNLISPSQIQKISPTRFRIVGLKPGWYWIEAFVKNVGVQEVLRYVPESPNEAKIYRLLEDWTYEDGVFELQKINIQSVHDKAPENFVNGQEYKRVEGGRFVDDEELLFKFGKSRPDLMKGTNLVASFYVSPFEVTKEQYRNVIQSATNSRIVPYLDHVKKLPETKISYYHACRYCELVGGRLMSYREYVFLATNAGRTKRPWGDSDEVLVYQDEPVGSCEFDVTLNEPKIYGLCSGCSEWTIDMNTKPEWVQPGARNRDTFAAFYKNRIIVGTEDYTATAAPDQNSSNLGPRVFLGAILQSCQLPSDSFERTGFRCARSITPRIISVAEYLEYMSSGYEKMLASEAPASD